MNFTSFFRGHTVESIFENLLSHAGYTIVPFGIEKTIREVRTFNREDYLSMVENTNKTLRYMPDFFVLDNENKKGWLVEVKYRKDFEDNDRQSFIKEVNDNYKNWRPFILLLAVGNPPQEWDTEKIKIKLIRAFVINEDIDKDFFIKNTKRIQEVFTKLSDPDIAKEGTLFKAQEAIESFTKNYDNRTYKKAARQRPIHDKILPSSQPISSSATNKKGFIYKFVSIAIKVIIILFVFSLLASMLMKNIENINQPEQTKKEAVDTKKTDKKSVQKQQKRR